MKEKDAFRWWVRLFYLYFYCCGTCVEGGNGNMVLHFSSRTDVKLKYIQDKFRHQGWVLAEFVYFCPNWDILINSLSKLGNVIAPLPIPPKESEIQSSVSTEGWFSSGRCNNSNPDHCYIVKLQFRSNLPPSSTQIPFSPLKFHNHGLMVPRGWLRSAGPFSLVGCCWLLHLIFLWH